MYEHGHIVLQLALCPYHMNAIKLIWFLVRGCCSSVANMGGLWRL
jgi:hypothetical protein